MPNYTNMVFEASADGLSPLIYLLASTCLTIPDVVATNYMTALCGPKVVRAPVMLITELIRQARMPPFPVLA